LFSCKIIAQKNDFSWLLLVRKLNSEIKKRKKSMNNNKNVTEGSYDHLNQRYWESGSRRPWPWKKILVLVLFLAFIFFFATGCMSTTRGVDRTHADTSTGPAVTTETTDTTVPGIARKTTEMSPTAVKLAFAQTKVGAFVKIQESKDGMTCCGGGATLAHGNSAGQVVYGGVVTGGIGTAGTGAVPPVHGGIVIR
jgi:hypothetical protein